MLDDAHPQAVDQTRLVRARARERDPVHARPLRRVRDRQRAARGPHRAVERQLAEQRDTVQLLTRQLPAGGQHRARDRQIEPRTGLADVARREVRGDPPGGKLIAGVEDRRGDALARLAHRRVDEPDDRKRRQPTAHVDLDGHVSRPQAVDRERVCPRQHRGASSLAVIRTGRRS